MKELNKTFGTSSRPPRSRPAIAKTGWRDAGATSRASTFNKDTFILRTICDYAQQDSLILDTPARIVKGRKIVDKEIVTPTREEYEWLLKAITDLDGRTQDSAKLVQLLALSGMRLGEATRIVWREVDFEKGQFTVLGGEVGTKNGETRIVPLFPRLRRFLEQIRPDREEFR